MQVKLYVHATPEAMFKAGKQAGLSDEAAEQFRYADEFELDLEVLQDGTIINGEMMPYGS